VDPNFSLEHYPYLSRRLPVFAPHGVVAASEPLAAQAGLDVLRRGGNALDAALATAIALTVVEPTCNGIGGDVSALIWDGQVLHGMNGSGRAPRAHSRELFIQRGLKAVPKHGWLAVTVPGAPRAWHDLHRRFGRLPFEALFEPAIEYAANGYPVSPCTALRWQLAAKVYGSSGIPVEDASVRPWREAFTRDGRPPRAGEMWTVPDLAPTLRELASTHCESFYRGNLARRMVDFAARTGGLLSRQDLEEHEGSWVQPIHTSYRGHELWEMPPSSQGIAALTALPENVLDYEIGVKSDWAVAGMPLRTNLALYETSYHNIQVQQQVPNVTLATAVGGGQCTQTQFNAGNCVGFLNENITLNAAAGKIYGVEWDVTLLPTDWLTLNAAGSYIDPRYTDFSFLIPPGYLQPSSGTNLSGTPIPVPSWQTNETATVNFGTDLGGLPLGDTVFTAHYYWQSRYLADLRSFNPLQRTFAYGLLNFRLEFTDVGHTSADLALFMNNVVNTQACLPEYNGVLNSAPNGTFGSPNTSGVLQCIPLAPRMMGITLGYKF